MFTDRKGAVRAGKTRRIGCIGLAEESSQALGRMLDVVSRRTKHPWVIEFDPVKADVVFVAAQSGLASTSRNANAPVVMVIQAETTNGVAGLALCHPFRVMPLLDLLLVLEQQMDQPVARRTESATGLLGAIRQLQHHGGSQIWYRGKARTGADLWVKSDATEVRTDADTWQRIRAGTAACQSLHATPELPDSRACITLPLSALTWFTALHAEDDLVAEALSGRDAFKIRHWPDFGRLGAERWQLMAAARMARTPTTLPELARFARQDESALRRFVHACEHAGLLEHVPAVQSSVPAPATARKSAVAPSLIGGLFSALRDRLGFGTNAA